jgi:PAS domain S-box-containing protein
VAIGIAVAIGYFFSARLSLLLQALPEDVAVFWPASGIAVGVLVSGGQRIRGSVIGGIMAATFIANMLDNRNAASAASFAITNAIEAAITAGLIERWFGSGLRLDRLRHVLGFIIAAGVGAGVAAVPAALAMRLFHSSAPLFDTWRIWAVSDGLGIITIAPLLIELPAAIRHPPSAREQLEAGAALSIFVLAVVFVFTLPPEAWLAFEPIAVLFPLLFWMAARYHPVWASAAVCVVAIGLVWTTTFGIGSFGDPKIPIGDRVLAAQAGMAISALCKLYLSALFAERRVTEEELERSNRRLQLALDGAELGVWDLDAITGRFEGDVRHRRIHRDGERVTTLSQMSRRCVHPDDVGRLNEAVATAFETGVFKAEYRITAAGSGADRGERWVAAEASVVRNADGRPLRLLGVARDVTAGKRAAEVLKESEARLRDALAAGQVMAFEWDPVTGRTRHSENASEILGLKENGDRELSGRDFVDRVHPDDKRRLKASVAGISPDNPSYALNFRYVRTDGREVWLEETARAEFDEAGRFVRLKGLTRDVTARRAAQQALIESERQLRLLVESVGDYAIIMLDPKGVVMSWNVGAERITGYTAEEITGQRFSRFYPIEDNANAEQALKTAERVGRHESEGWRVRKNGTRFWASVVIDAIRDDDGKLLGFANVTRDVSERRRMEEHQQLLIAELDHRVKNALASVAIVARRTRETSGSVGEFVSALEGRIQSMANAHGLLSRSHWQGVRLSDLVHGEIAPYANEHNTLTSGPDVVLTSRATQTIAIVLHELATNAAKYGAFSSPQGRVAVNWSIPANGKSPGSLKIEWVESGGPTACASPRQGYGTSVIRNLIPHQLDGAVDLTFATEGVRCHIDLPLLPSTCSSAVAA